MAAVNSDVEERGRGRGRQDVKTLQSFMPVALAFLIFTLKNLLAAGLAGGRLFLLFSQPACVSVFSVWLHSVFSFEPVTLVSGSAARFSCCCLISAVQ